MLRILSILSIAIFAVGAYAGTHSISIPASVPIPSLFSLILVVGVGLAVWIRFKKRK